MFSVLVIVGLLIFAGLAVVMLAALCAPAEELEAAGVVIGYREERHQALGTPIGGGHQDGQARMPGDPDEEAEVLAGAAA